MPRRPPRGYRRVSDYQRRHHAQAQQGQRTQRQDVGPAVDQGGDLDDITVNFVTIRESHSLAPLLRGLPGDSCQCPHWGYLFAGKITVTNADREETYQTGDAFYMTPGHVPAAEAGTEFVQFSPKEQLAETMAAMMANARRAMSGG
jgi:hypothetical protein